MSAAESARPLGEEEAARRFYAGLPGWTEVPKPAVLAVKRGVWFEGGAARLHLAVEADFRPAKKAPPAFVVENLSGFAPTAGDPLDGVERLHIEDPSGNRLQLLEYARP